MLSLKLLLTRMQMLMRMLRLMKMPRMTKMLRMTKMKKMTRRKKKKIQILRMILRLHRFHLVRPNSLWLCQDPD